MITKTRKQGNSIMLTVPKEFDVPNGVEVEAKLVENGILYEFVEPKKEFFDLLNCNIKCIKNFKNLYRQRITQ